MKRNSLCILSILSFSLLCTFAANAQWRDCDIEVYYSRTQTLLFSGLQSEVWPQPPWDPPTTKDSADFFRDSQTLAKHEVRVGESSKSFWLTGSRITYAFVQYYEQECGSHFRGSAKVWQFIGSYRGSKGAWISLWALKNDLGKWNTPVYLHGRGHFYRTNQRW